MSKDITDQVMGDGFECITEVYECHGDWKVIVACMVNDSRYCEYVFHGTIYTHEEAFLESRVDDAIGEAEFF